MRTFPFPLPILLLAAIFWIQSFQGQDSMNSYSFNEYRIDFNDSICTVLDTESSVMDTVYVNANEKSYYFEENGNYKSLDGSIVDDLRTRNPERYMHITKENRPYIWKTSNSLRSAVGPFLSYNHSYYGDGGAHPSYGQGIETYHVIRKDSVDLRELFSEQDLLKQLMADTVITEYLLVENPSTLDEMMSHLYSDCDYNFGQAMLSAFAFNQIKGGKVYLSIGIGHGCEVMRGNYYEVNLVLDIPPLLKEWLSEADRAGLLLEQ